ncbi:Kae1-associated kinase Bud32 [Candidatus Woesearchaeota archaeon CG10_big_fil_rev_8_21_14_0_10_44_13]|nr:MAG: Kae1-associated kinase Bud32 [Candidatus Woesearchaeota archaeon CG10_big_fil_rev_8_21_14_0_10_44_13]
MNLIAQGAEAKLFAENGEILKQRFEKAYRHPLIDMRLRKCRTRQEARLLERLALMNFPSPRLADFSDKSMEIRMQQINGVLLKDVLHEKHLEFSNEIGRRVAELHNKNIIHGDLTTSNMMLDSSNRINFIDFGLSFISDKAEDKAVDLHLLKQALESKHYLIFEECFNTALDAYKEHGINSELVMQRLEKVESRGRNKRKND